MELQFDPYSVAPILASTLIFATGIWVRTIAVRQDVRVAFVRLTSAVAFAFFIQGFMFMASDEGLRLLLEQLIWIPLSLIAPSIAMFMAAIFNLSRLKRLAPFLFFFGLISGLTAMTPWFFSETVYTYPWAAQRGYGPLGIFALVMMMSGITAAGVGLFFIRRKVNDPLVRKRLSVLIFATLLGSLGALDFLQNFGFPIPPTGAVWIAIWILVYVYAIKRYQLFDLTPEFASLAVIEAIPGALFITDDRRAISITNDTPLGFEGPTLVKRKVSEVLPGIDGILDGIEKDEGALHSDPRELDVELPDGRTVPALVTASVIRQEGRVYGFAIIAEDITRIRKQLGTIEERNRELAKTMEDMKRLQESLVGREMRMIELKARIAELEGKK